MSLLIVAAVIIFTLWASLYVGGMSDNFSDESEDYEFKHSAPAQTKKYAPYFHRKRFKNFSNRR